MNTPSFGTADDPADLLVVGAGLVAATLVAELRQLAPGTRVLMVDAGNPIGSTVGAHLHDSDEPAVREEYLQKVSPGIQSLYVGAETTPTLGGTVRGARPGMYNVSAFGSTTTDMPAAAVGWNAGGMGVHWTAATPTPFAEEVFGEETWVTDLARASEHLHVREHPYPRTVAGERVMDVVREHFEHSSAPGRTARDMPMAMPVGYGELEDGPLPRTGPSTVLPRMTRPAGPDFELLTGTTALEILHESGTVTGVRVRDTETGVQRVLHARSVAVAADTLRTPQLLFASGVRPPALGRYLNEHAFLTGQVIVDHARFGLRLQDLPRPRVGEWLVGSYWLPHSGKPQPFHGQLMDRLYVQADGRPLAYALGLSFYVPTEVRAENRLEFSETVTDAAGLPAMEVHFDLSTADRELLDRARDVQRSLAVKLGDFDPARDSALLPAGSSLHWTGTTRSGETDDGTSVCDPSGQVWGFQNLHVAGGSVVPTAIVGNSTLVNAVTAVRAARRIAAAVPTTSGRVSFV